VNLATADVDIAKSIAYNIREKTGGIPGVRALGLELTSRKITQVSINITRCGEAGLKLVYDEVFKWSKEYGVEIIESELVGMIPQAAVFAGMREYLKLSNYSDNLIIEKHFA
jgi:glutamate formiminotransferase